RENIKPKKVKVRGVFEVKFYQPDGVERIRKVFSQIKPSDGAKIEISYIGAPKYRIVVEAEDYKSAETVLREIVETILKSVKKLAGEANFIREAL
ncbi:MAG: translation initiation factor IF-2 subunit alpha, partial [Archaeoglobaceae archaeon]